jgi:uncharacterized protein YeaO (DUF488 family)
MSETEIRTKRIYERATASDGTRVLVDRLWPRGVSRASAAVDLWLTDIAPSAALRTWFHHDPARFSAFRTCYQQELDDNPAAVDSMLVLMKPGRLTLLYAAHDLQHNHAIVLADYLRRRMRAQGEGGVAKKRPVPAETEVVGHER